MSRLFAPTDLTPQPLGPEGIEGVRNNPASHAERRLVATIDLLRKGYLDVADALLPNSDSPEQVAAEARRLRADNERLSAAMSAPRRCTVFRDHCPEHNFVHGLEAEELRRGIEKILERLGQFTRTDCQDMVSALQRLLDKVDARDSLAYLEATL